MLQVAVYRSTCFISIWNMRLPTPYQLVWICFKRKSITAQTTRHNGRCWNLEPSSWRLGSTHHQTFEFQKKKQNSCLQEELAEVFACVFWCFFVLIAPNLKKLGNHGPYLHHMGSWRCEKPRDPLDSTSKMTNVNQPRKPVGRGGWFTQVVETVGNVYVFLPTHKSCQF